MQPVYPQISVAACPYRPQAWPAQASSDDQLWDVEWGRAGGATKAASQSQVPQPTWKAPTWKAASYPYHMMPLNTLVLSAPVVFPGHSLEQCQAATTSADRNLYHESGRQSSDSTCRARSAHVQGPQASYRTRSTHECRRISRECHLSIPLTQTPAQLESGMFGARGRRSADFRGQGIYPQIGNSNVGATTRRRCSRSPGANGARNQRAVNNRTPQVIAPPKHFTRDPSGQTTAFAHTLDGFTPDSCNSEEVAVPILGEDAELTEDGLPSVGSAGHADGTCKRCAFISKGRCKNGKDCTHCHYDHTHLRSRRRRRSPTKGRELADECVIAPLEVAHASPVNVESDPSSTPKLDGGDMFDSQAVKVDDSLVFGTLTPALQDRLPDLEAGGEPDSEQEGQPASERGSMQGTEQERESESEPEGETVGLVESVASTDVSHDVAVVQQAGLEEKDLALTRASSVATSCTSTPPVSDTEDTLATASTPSASPAASDSEPSSPQPSRRPGRKAAARLESSATSWVAQQKIRKADAAIQSALPSDVGRKARSLLNKLTDERFERLCEKMLALPLETPQHLAVVVSEIFDKATTEKSFLPLYAELCLRLDTHLAPGTGPAGGKAFRKALIAECQSSFERHLHPADLAACEHLGYEARYELEVKLKTQRLGNMRFVGELLVRKLLALKLLPMITKELLDASTEPDVGEPALESLVALLAVVGPQYDQASSLWSAALQEAFVELKRRSVEDAALSMRLRCQVRDLLELRSRAWAVAGTGK